MNTIKQKVCQFLEIALAEKHNGSDILELTNFILKSEIFLNKYYVELANGVSEESIFSTIVNAILEGKPIQYILNEAYFMDLVLFVDESVLIPRPETEELVYWVQSDHKYSNPLSIWDVGTGSGCISIFLKKCFPDWHVTGIDISSAALIVANRNAIKYKTQIEFCELDFLNVDINNLNEMHILISNPPYIGNHEKHKMTATTLAFEPSIALFPLNDDHLIFYKQLAFLGQKKLTQHGLIYCELNEFYSEQIYQIFKQAGYLDIEIKADLQGKPRMLRAQRGTEEIV